MALQGSYEDEHGVTHASAYAVVGNVRLDYLASRAIVTVNIFHDSTAKTNGKVPVIVNCYDYYGSDFTSNFGTAALSPVDANPQKNAYDDVKLKSDFSGWSDV